MTGAELAAALPELLEGLGPERLANVKITAAFDECTVTAPRADTHAVLEQLMSVGFDMLVFATAVDHPDHMTIVYRVGSMARGAELFVETDVGRDAPELPTATDIWPAADWHERETYDLFGVRFEGHPNLTRLLLPGDWDGHPLRKDYENPEMIRRPNYI